MTMYDIKLFYLFIVRMNALLDMIDDLQTYSKEDIILLTAYYNLSSEYSYCRRLVEIAMNNLHSGETGDMTLKFKDRDIEFDEDACFDSSVYEIAQQIGRGTFGVVHVIRLPDGKEIVAKFQDISTPVALAEFQKERDIGTFMGQQGIGPIIYETFVCNNIGVIFMEKMDGTMDTSTVTELDVASIVELVLRMHELGFTHNDLKSLNVLYKVMDDGTKDWRLSDFGLSFMNSMMTPKLKQRVIRNWEWMKQNYYNESRVQIYKDEAFDFISKELIKEHPDAIDAVFLYILLRLYNSKEQVQNYMSDFTEPDVDENMLDSTVSFQEDISI